MVLSGCYTDSPESKSSPSVSTSDTQSSVNEPASSSETLSSNGQESSFDSVLPPSSNNAETLQIEGANELRNPFDGTDHGIPSRYYLTESFINFRDRMKYFSNKLSSLFVQRYFRKGQNFVMSPLSIEMCLGLAIRSAGGETRNEILNAFGMDYDTFNTNFKLYFHYLHHTRKNESDQILSQLLLSNSIWIDDDIELKESGLDALKNDYYCYSYDTDFGNGNQANKAIRQFINCNTKGLLNPNIQLSPATLFVLMNVLYAKGIWNSRGSDLPYASNDYTFTNDDGSESRKRLLDGYYESGKPIVTEDYSSFFTTMYGYDIYFVKPNEGKDLKEVFNKETMNDVLDSNNIITQDDVKMEKYSTKCIFPEFEASGEFELSTVLRSDLNIETLFDPYACDMSGLTDDDVFCGEVKHLAKLEVNKKGMEGAAVTYMTAYGAGAPQPDPYTYLKYTFVVDKEFGFIVTHGDSVVFSGVVNNIDR